MLYGFHGFTKGKAMPSQTRLAALFLFHGPCEVFDSAFSDYRLTVIC